MATVKSLSITMLGATLVALGTGGVTQAAVIGTEEFSSAGGTIGIYTGYNLALFTSQSDRSYARGEAPLLEGTRITPADEGRTFTVTAATDTDFNDFVAFLTNGRNDYIFLEIDPFGPGDAITYGAMGVPEYNAFGGNSDLAGNTIDSISLRINSFTLDTPGSNPNGDGYWTDETFDATLIVEGQPSTQASGTPVPEPSPPFGSVMLLGFGVLMERQYSKKRKKI